MNVEKFGGQENCHPKRNYDVYLLIKEKRLNEIKQMHQ